MLDRDVDVPMTVGHAVAGLVVLPGNASAIADRLPDDLTPVRLPGGLGVVLLLCVDYRDNPLGAYDEVVVGLAARPLGMRGGPAVGLADVLRGRTGVWIEHMAVSEPFTRAAGEAIWGYPKTLDDLSLDIDARTARTDWARDGRTILTAEQSTTGFLPAPGLPVTTYTQVDGTTLRTGLRATARGVGVSLRGAHVRLGDHPLADDLAALGLGRRPLAAAWLSSVRMTFTDATPLHGGPA